MTHQKIEKMVAVMRFNAIKYNKQFDSILEHGFSDEAKESFVEEVLAELETVLEAGTKSGFNKSMKKAVLELTNLAVKSGEEGRFAVGLTKLRQNYRTCVSTLKLPKDSSTLVKPIISTAASAQFEREVVTEHTCRRCGAALIQNSEAQLKCKYCGSTYNNISAVENTEKMKTMFDATERKMVNNLLKNLHDAVNAEYISSEDVKNACVELKKYIPDDFRANFYLTVISRNSKAVKAAIRSIDVDRYYDDVEAMINLLIKSLELDYLLELNDLVERAYKTKNLQSYGKYITQISKQAEKVEAGVYETKLPREVFVAYSSKDMKYVSELVDVLEGQGLQCFVAERNLRHGKGSVEDYEKAIQEAIDHCRSFVFVSTPNSRAFSCDAVRIELPYVKKHDIENSPPEYRNNYESIPHKYKKSRVEYRVESSKHTNAADKITSEFFHGYEWALSPEDVADRIMKQLVDIPTASTDR